MEVFVIQFVTILFAVGGIIKGLFGASPTVLSCGLFGAAPKEGQKADLHKLQILGLWNERRGPDSCGYYYAGNIQKGIDGFKLIGDLFMTKPFVKGELDTEIFMGHTRKSTSGVHNAENAHPHRIEEYVQTHNGIIRNPTSLLNKYDIKDKIFPVDSIALARIIQQRGYDVLHDYEGFAALAMTYTNNPEVLYLYHGASKDKMKDPEPLEERPLWIVDLPEAIYYSSIYNSLLHLTNGEVKPQRVPHNRVYKITKGILDKEPIFVVNREETNVSKTVVTHIGNFDELVYDEKTKIWTRKASSLELPFPTNLMALGKDELPEEADLIMRETAPEEEKTQMIAYRHGRYYYTDNGNLINGKLRIDRDGIILYSGIVSNRANDDYFFFNGIMLRDEKAYKDALLDERIPARAGAYAFKMSKYSRYATVGIKGEGELIGRYNYMWWKDGKKFSGRVQVKFAGREYMITDGVLKTIIPASSTDLPLTAKSAKIINIVDGGIIEKVIPKVPSQDDVLLDNMVDIVHQWCDKVISAKDIKELPEHFLMLIEWALDIMYTREFPGQEGLKSYELEEQTTDYLKDLIKRGVSLKESLRGQYEWLVAPNEIRKCFDGYSVDELIQLQNRYEFMDFDDKPINDASLVIDTLPPANERLDEYVKEEFVANFNKSIDKLIELREVADSFQALDSSDEAQQACFAMYRSIDVMRDKLTTITGEPKYAFLAGRLQKIKSIN